MSCNYADGLSPYHDKGQLGLDERFDSKSVVTAKVALLAKWINEAKHVVVHSGAGISTSAGIPDFRGPKGVWTLQAKGEKPGTSVDFNEAIPTATHMAITKLVETGKVKYVVSQNIDGLHVRSNLQRKFLSELHGNMFVEQCNACNRQFVRNAAVPTVGQKSLNKACPTIKANGRPCRGRLHDTILDWEHSLPENDLGMADYHSCMADLSICLGTTMQIVPSGNLPLYTKKHGGKLVICNLQPTKHDRKADLLIHAYVDEVMTLLMKNLNLKIPKYTTKNDPTKTLSLSPDKYFEWTISDYALKKMKKIYEEKCGTKEARKRLEMIDDDLPLSITKTLKRTKGKDEDDSDLEVLDVIVKPKKGSSSKEKRGQKKNSASASTTAVEPPPTTYNTTITVKKITTPAKKAKYEGEKITIKKNVTPTKTKYEIVQPKPKKLPKCEIVYGTDSDLCNDLDMICESDDDETLDKYTYNFKRYLQDEKEVKKEDDKKNIEILDESNVSGNEVTQGSEVNGESKQEIKLENEENNAEKSQNAEGLAEESPETDKEVATATDEEKSEDNHEVNIATETEKIETTSEESMVTNSDSEKSAIGNEPIKECENPTESNSETAKTVEESAGAVESIEESSEALAEENIPELESEAADLAKDSLSGNIEAETNIAQADTTASDSIEKGAVTEDEGCKSTNIESMEVDSTENEVEGTNVSEQSEDHQTEEAKQVSDADKANDPVAHKQVNLYGNLESEISNLASSNIDSSIDQFVTQSEPSQFDSSLTIPDSTINPTMNEYGFYSNEYTSSSNTPDLDYVANSYYNNF